MKDDGVTIIANPAIDQQKFIISKVLICSRSKYFDRALNGPFKESKQNEVELHDVDIQSVQALLYWLYHNELQSGGAHVYEYPVPNQEVILTRLSILANRLMVAALQGLAFKELCQRLKYDRLNADTICEIYNNTAPDSNLRQLACHVVACITLRLYHADGLAEYARCFAELKGFGSDVCLAVNHMVLIKGKRSWEGATLFDFSDVLGHLDRED